MIRPNFIPRTLRGVGGVRLYDIPGVIYPKEILQAAKGREQSSGKPYTKPPAWGVTTREAAKLLSCTPAAARMAMQRRKVRYRMVKEPGNVPRLYWNRKEIERMAEARLPIVTRIPAKTLTAEQACALLHICRSSLHRYARKGRIRERSVRLMTKDGTRKMCLYIKADVKKLAARLNAIHAHEEAVKKLKECWMFEV